MEDMFKLSGSDPVNEFSFADQKGFLLEEEGRELKYAVSLNLFICVYNNPGYLKSTMATVFLMSCAVSRYGFGSKQLAGVWKKIRACGKQQAHEFL